MPVTIQLVHLVGVPGCRSLWPRDFNTQIKLLEGDEHEGEVQAVAQATADEKLAGIEYPTANDRRRWAVLADWCADECERELEEAIRWFLRRPEAVITKRYKTWQFVEKDYVPVGVPYSISSHMRGGAIDCSTLAGFMAQIAYAIAKVKEELL